MSDDRPSIHSKRILLRQYENRKAGKRKLMMALICVIILLAALWMVYRQASKHEVQIERQTAYISPT